MAKTRDTGAAKTAASRAGKRSTARGRSGRAGANAKAAAIKQADRFELDQEAARLLGEYDELLSTEIEDEKTGKRTKVLALKGWTDAHKREQTHAVILGNVQTNLEIRRLRGSLIPREEATKAAEDVRDAFMTTMPSFGRDVVEMVEGLTPKQKREVRSACDAHLKRILEAAVASAGNSGGKS